MATQVQFRGGTTTQNDAFTGAAREITVDTTKDTLVVHDGATQGGFPLVGEIGSQRIKAPDKGDRYFFESLDAQGAQMSLYNSSDAQKVRISADSSADTFFLDTKVGIGTNAPAHELHVSSSTTPTFRLSGNTNTFEIKADSGTTAIRNTTGTNLEFGTDNTGRFNIDTSGTLNQVNGAFSVTAAGAVTCAGDVLTENSGNGTLSRMQDQGGIFTVRPTGSTDVLFNGGRVGETNNCIIYATGAATFAGDVYSGTTTTANNAYNGAYAGVRLYEPGTIYVARSGGTNAIFEGYTTSDDGTTSSSTCKITAAGTATFSGSLTLNGTGGSNAWMVYDGGSSSAQVTYDGIYRAGSISGADANILLTGSTGNAEFTGLMKSGSAQVKVASAGTNNLYGGNSYFGDVGDDSNDSNAYITNTGAGWFGANTTIGGYDSTNSATKGIQLQTGGCVLSQSDTGADSLWLGFLSAVQKSKITADGQMTLASTLTCSTLTETSDQRFKNNITDANPQLADVTALGGKLRNWDWNDEAPVSEKDIRFLGLVAQEVESICPGIIHTVQRTKDGAELTPESTDADGNVTPATYEQVDDSYKTIKTSALVFKLLGAVAELSEKVAALEAA